MDLSYAQHLEDYHLSMAFAGQARGFYIDIGAGHPVADNVSCWFYLNGWNGIVVEPQRNLLDLYPYLRPRDIAVNYAIGHTVGETDFHQVERLHGFSTIVPQAAERARGFGVEFKTHRLPMTTLASLCAEHKVDQIDFLKIDVEGAEADVLRGGDWQRWRPRIVLLEARAPGTMAPAWHEWEPFLLGQNYHFGLDDGLNRFYVAAEDADLRQRLPSRPAPWLVVPHLGHTNRAPERVDHPDHGFAKALARNFLAGLPRLDRQVLLGLILAGADPARLSEPPGPEDVAQARARLFPAAPFEDASAGLPSIEAKSVLDLYRQLLDTDHFRF